MIQELPAATDNRVTIADFMIYTEKDWLGASPNAVIVKTHRWKGCLEINCSCLLVQSYSQVPTEWEGVLIKKGLESFEI